MVGPVAYMKKDDFDVCIGRGKNSEGQQQGVGGFPWISSR